jgi:hypothetical protein
MRFIFILLALLVMVGLQPQVYAQTNSLIYGRTLSADRINIVQLASVLNTNQQKRAISNRQGYFKVLANPSDTIIITAIGYDSILFIAQELMSAAGNDTIVVLLKSKNYLLKEAKIVSSNPKRDSLARAAAEFLKTDPLMNNYDRILNRQKGGLMSPLTAMYQQFSKEGKDAARFEDFLYYMEKQKLVDRRFNRDFVKKATNLPDIQLDEFMVYCKPDKDFVLSASEYELIAKVQQCAHEFNNKRRQR